VDNTDRGGHGRHPPSRTPAEDQRRVPPRKPEANLTDPDWRITKTRTGWIQGFKGRLAVTGDYLILTTQLSTSQ
jgi:hypothetical protein